MRDRADQPPEAQPDTLWPLLLCLLVVVGGGVTMALGQWRSGAIIVGAATLLAAGMRLVLPRQVAGLLVMRRRWIDVLVLAGLGIAIIAVAVSVPPGP